MSAPAPMRYNGEQAKRAEQGQRIDSTGAYVGILTKVKWEVKQSGAAGYEIDFMSIADQTAERLFICTIGKTNNPLEIGEAKIAALMCCLGVKEANPVQGQVEEYDFDAGKKMLKTAHLFPDAMNKPIGLVLQKDTYSKQNGEDGIRMQFECCFHAESRRTAQEMIDKTDAVYVDNLLGWLGDKDSRTNVAAPAGYQPQQTGVAPGGGGFDDDIPYAPVSWLI